MYNNFLNSKSQNLEEKHSTKENISVAENIISNNNEK